MAISFSRAQVIGYRLHAQQLDRTAGSLADTAVLDLGVQDTGSDGGPWALANRGVSSVDNICTVWTIRGAPHLYRRADMGAVVTATSPFSESDAAKRIFDASKPLRAAGIGIIDALDAVAAAERSIVTRPTVKGDLSTRLTPRMDEPYRHFCRACDATHLYEMPFRWPRCGPASSCSPARPRRSCSGLPASSLVRCPHDST